MTTFDPDLLDALEACEIDRVAGTVWRQVLDPSSVLTSNLRGSRWNPPNVEALYVSLESETAAAEIQHLIDAQSVPIRRQRATYSLDIQVGRVADLRADPIGERFVFDLDTSDAAACATVGAAASWLGLGGLLVPSLRSSGSNMVIFVANMDPDDNWLQQDARHAFPPGPNDTAIAAAPPLRRC